MLVPIAAVNVGIGDGIAAVDHFSVTNIDADMGYGVAGGIRPLEKDQVAGFGFLGGYRGAEIV